MRGIDPRSIRTQQPGIPIHAEKRPIRAADFQFKPDSLGGPAGVKDERHHRRRKGRPYRGEYSVNVRDRADLDEGSEEKMHEIDGFKDLVGGNGTVIIRTLTRGAAVGAVHRHADGHADFAGIQETFGEQHGGGESYRRCREDGSA